MEIDLKAELVFELSVDCADAIEIRKTDKGVLRMIPVVGGTFQGKNISGKVIPVGANWNTKIVDRLSENVKTSHVLVKYTIQTNDGAYIYVENEGFGDLAEERKDIITSSRFQTKEGKYSWLNYGIFVGNLRLRDDKTGIEIKIYKMK